MVKDDPSDPPLPQRSSPVSAVDTVCRTKYGVVSLGLRFSLGSELDGWTSPNGNPISPLLPAQPLANFPLPSIRTSTGPCRPVDRHSSLQGDAAGDPDPDSAAIFFTFISIYSYSYNASIFIDTDSGASLYLSLSSGLSKIDLPLFGHRLLVSMPTLAAPSPSLSA